MFSSSKLRIASTLTVVALVLGGGAWALQNMDRSSQSEMTDRNGSEGLVPSNTDQISGVPSGDQQPTDDPRTGSTPDAFLMEFMKKLNEVNAYVWTNDFEKAVEIDAVYKELWAWAESNDLRIRAVLSQGAVDAGNTEFQPQPAPFLELVTADGLQYCAADVEILDPERDPDDVLLQALMAGSCEDFFTGVRPTTEG